MTAPKDQNAQKEMEKKAAPLAVPNLDAIPRADEVVGRNPMGISLRDHPELSGMDFIPVQVKYGEGLIDGNATNFVIAGGFLVKPGQAKLTQEDAVVLITGAENVYARILAADLDKKLPMRGTLRKSGRAWFLD